MERILEPQRSWRLRQVPRHPGAFTFAAAVVLAAVANVGLLAAAERSGTPLNDPDLVALLRPSEPIVEDQLTQGQDGKVYYSAKLKRVALPGFTKRYLAELENRGIRITPLGSSPHVVPQRGTGYVVVAWQEASLNPYTIRAREGQDDEDSDADDSPMRPSYPHPVSVMLNRLVVRLPAEFAKPWETVVVVPTESQAKLPFAVPLPADAIVLGMTELRSREWGGKPAQVTNIIIPFLSRLPPEDVRRFFKQALEGWGTVLREETSTSWRFDRLPPWAPPRSKSFKFEPQGALRGLPKEGTAAFLLLCMRTRSRRRRCRISPETCGTTGSISFLSKETTR